MATKSSKKIAEAAQVFSALGDETRLSLLKQLSKGELQSISRLAVGRQQTRQAIRKHLDVLEKANLVTVTKSGREQLYQIEFKTMQTARSALQEISTQWEDALARLKKFVE